VSGNKPAIPAELERSVLVECGHRCAIPTCRQHPIEIAHIVPWATVRKHGFNNLVALCPTCHARYDKGEIDRKSMFQYKQALSVLNSRYGDLERRVLEQLAIRRRAWRTRKDWAAEVTRRTNGEYPKRVIAISDDFQGAERDAMIRYLQGVVADQESGMAPDSVQLPGGQELMLWYLIRDGYLRKVNATAGIVVAGMALVEWWQLTPEGAEFVDRWAEAQPLEVPELPLPPDQSVHSASTT
jgi:hypothetical protein